MGSLEEAPGAGFSVNEQPRRDDSHEIQVYTPKLSQRSKRTKLESGESDRNRALIDVAGLNALRDIVQTVQWSKYGSAAPAIHELYSRKLDIFSTLASFQRDNKIPENIPGVKKVHKPSACSSSLVINIDSDDEEEKDRTQIVPVIDKELHMPISSDPLQADTLLIQQEELPSPNSVDPLSFYPPEADTLMIQQQEDLLGKSLVCKILGIKTREGKEDQALIEKEDQALIEKEDEVDVQEKDNRMFLGVDDDLHSADGSNVEDDDLGDIWNQMSIDVEMLKDYPVNLSPNEQSKKDEPDCDHSYILKDDIGYVCRVCGVVSREIQSIIEVQYKKYNWSRTYPSSRGHKEGDDRSPVEKIKVSGHVSSPNEVISADPRHVKLMKPHQIEGFTFLTKNLLDKLNPGGCILAHAPGSGKTFMIISFMQSFLANCSDGRPLVVLPKGILSTWRKEFERWKIEDTLLLDFYSLRADSRVQQLEILKQWKDNKSVLFLGYNSFARIMSDTSNSVVTLSCQEILINLPSIMILDEGHTPRNENTNVLHSVSKVKTPRKIVLSGTLYQNHVKEVFNILNLVRPKFMKLEKSRAIRKRIMSYVPISGVRKQLKGNEESVFYELVEYALQRDEDHKRKEFVIQDLRKMTSSVLHYYRGDSLDELPGLVDFTVCLKLNPEQKVEVDKLMKEEKKLFKRTSLGCIIYMHPILKKLSDRNAPAGEKRTLASDDKIDEMIGRIDIRDGVKAKFFLSMLSFCEAAKEKLLVFSQYLLPLKFLERLAACKKGWSVGREMFMISGDSTPDQREIAVGSFNKSPDARVFFGSIKACGEGISLVGASRIIILDVHLNPSVSRQAIGRAFRPGQVKKVFAYRLVAADSPEQEDHLSCFKKELISKWWFESNANQRMHDFEMEEVDVKESGDKFFESSHGHHLVEDVKFLHQR